MVKCVVKYDKSICMFRINQFYLRVSNVLRLIA